jgi:hypothetical protein
VCICSHNHFPSNVNFIPEIVFSTFSLFYYYCCLNCCCCCRCAFTFTQLISHVTNSNFSFLFRMPLLLPFSTYFITMQRCSLEQQKNSNVISHLLIEFVYIKYWAQTKTERLLFYYIFRFSIFCFLDRKGMWKRKNQLNWWRFPTLWTLEIIFNISIIFHRPTSQQLILPSLIFYSLTFWWFVLRDLVFMWVCVRESADVVEENIKKHERNSLRKFIFLLAFSFRFLLLFIFNFFLLFASFAILWQNLPSNITTEWKTIANVHGDKKDVTNWYFKHERKKSLKKLFSFSFISAR